jgi:putative hydrolase of the HAD superfamily
VFFDAVGTLIAAVPEPAQVYTAAARRQGLEVAEADVRKRLRAAFTRQETLDRANDLRVDEPRERQRWQQIVAKSLPELEDSASCFDELWEHFAQPGAWRLFPQVGKVLGELAGRGLAMGIASNFDARLHSIVAGLPELAPVRERCVISSLVGYRKPSRRFFDAVVAAARCAPESILFIGDDPENDIAGARSAGLRPILLDPHAHPGDAERIASLNELLEM